MTGSIRGRAMLLKVASKIIRRLLSTTIPPKHVNIPNRLMFVQTPHQWGKRESLRVDKSSIVLVFRVTLTNTNSGVREGGRFKTRTTQPSTWRCKYIFCVVMYLCYIFPHVKDAWHDDFSNSPFDSSSCTYLDDLHVNFMPLPRKKCRVFSFTWGKTALVWMHSAS